MRLSRRGFPSGIGAVGTANVVAGLVEILEASFDRWVRKKALGVDRVVVSYSSRCGRNRYQICAI
jgi:hypothetical protein